MEELASRKVKPQLLGALPPALPMEDYTSCLVVSSQPKRNTAELSSIIEALSFLGPNGPVSRDSQACIFYDSKHAASICLGTIQSRATVALGLTCQRLLLQVHVRLRITLQHIYSHAQNLGNERADHAAALGAYGLISNQNTLVGSTLHLTLLLCLLHVVT